jgi:hypothetical protein
MVLVDDGNPFSPALPTAKNRELLLNSFLTAVVHCSSVSFGK